MNAIDRFFLWLFLLPQRTYTKLGVDVSQLTAILTAKLTMDNRRPNTFGSGNRRRTEKKEINKATLGTIFGSLLVGVFMLYCFGIGIDMITKLSLFMSMFIFMLCMTLITDFTSVLIDIRDNLIILPKPVSDRTFLFSRLLHIAIRICIVVVPMTLPACITLAIIEGYQTILPFILITILMTLFSIFIINAVYILILKITTPAKFQSVIGSIQIGFVILLMAGYQLMPRMIQNSIISKTSISEFTFTSYYPPYWFADACLIFAGKGGNQSLLNPVLSVIVPLFSIFLVVRYFAPAFSRKLSMITGSSAEIKAPVKKNKDNKKTFSFFDTIAKFITKPGAERTGFIFTNKMTGRSRDYKMKVYPSLGYMVVFGLIMAFQKDGSFGNFASSDSVAPMLLFIIYLSSMFLSTALLQLPYTDKFKASWLFFVTPVSSPGLLISGAVKCILVKFFLPLVLFITALGIALQDPSIIPNMILGCVNVLAIATFIAYLSFRKIPFSSQQEGTAKGSTFIKSMAIMIAPVGFGILHWLISGYIWVVIVMLPVSLIIPYLLFDGIKKQSWSKLYPDLSI